MSQLSTRVQRILTGGATGTWEKIFSLAKLEGVVDLGQGYPDFEGSSIARETAAKTLLDNPRLNQYSPINGLTTLVKELASFYEKTYPPSPRLDEGSEIIVTAGGTEGLFDVVQAFVNEGDEVVLFEPFFPWYLPLVKYAGGIAKVVTLEAPNFEVTEEALASVMSEKTKLLIFNTPHNPTGHVASKKELELIAKYCIKYNTVAFSDEVYEATTFRNYEHLRLVDIEGMRNRTITLGSASKLLSLTGWRVGWVYGSKELLQGVRSIHGYNCFCAPTPLQAGVSEALVSTTTEEFEELGNFMSENYERLSKALEKINLKPCPVQGGYFLVADASSYNMTDIEFCEWLAKNKKIAAVPMGVFYTETPRECLIRFALCKKRETMDKVIENLSL